jgi:DNA-binding NarL/FixJ family response regulator
MQAKISTILADDHPLVLRGLADLLAGDPDFEVVAVATDGRTALGLIEEKQPDIAVLDVVMPGLSGIEVLNELVHRNSEVKIVFLSALITEAQSLHAMANGAWGILLKESAPETLIECMREVHAGRRWMPAELFQRSHVSREPVSSGSTNLALLTDREREIVSLVSEALPNKLIARRLNLTEGTVKIHLHNIFGKLNVKTRSALILKMLT